MAGGGRGAPHSREGCHDVRVPRRTRRDARAQDPRQRARRLAKRRYSDGTTNRLSRVEVTRPPRITIGHRVLDLVAGNVAGDDQRHQRQAGRQRGHQDRREPLLRAAQHQLGAEGLALVALEVLVVADQHDAVAGGDPEDGEEADQRAEREDAVAERGRQHAADQRQRQASRRTAPPAASCRRRRAGAGRSPIAAAIAKHEQALLGRLPLGVLAEHLGVVPERELDVFEPLPRPRRRPSRGRAPRRWRSTSIRREASSRLISFGVGTIRTSATSPRRTWPPSGVSISRSRCRSRLSRVCGRAPDDDVVGLAGP